MGRVSFLLSNNHQVDVGDAILANAMMSLRQILNIEVRDGFVLDSERVPSFHLVRTCFCSLTMTIVTENKFIN